MENKKSPANWRADQLRGNGGPSDSPQPATNKLVVSGFPVYTQERELEYLFVSYGAPRVERMEGRSAVMKFRSAADAAAALRARPLLLYGELLTVSADERQHRLRDKNEKVNKRPRPKNDQKQEMELDPAKIDFSGDFHQQLASVLAFVRLNQEEVTQISGLYADVEAALQEYWPGCTANPFGSITSGLGIKTSDADCFVHVPQEVRYGETVFVQRAKKLLQRYPGTFRQVLCIPRANTPIVKFLHVPTKTNCDVSFKTPLGVRNSKLIAFLLHVDPRLIPVAVLIKYWGKAGGFTGSGKLTNYALTMLLIFYLQQLAILPAVSWLQSDNSTYHEVDCWNTGFLCQYDALPKPESQASIPELIGGFFQYYSEFNFQEDVVSPFLGRTIKKSSFKDLSLLPSEYKLYINNVKEKYVFPLRVSSPICIQDPFEQCHNVASVMSERCAQEAKAFFAFAAEAYKQDQKNNSVGFLKKILLEKPKLPPKKISPEFRTVIRERELCQVKDPDWQSVVREVTFKIFEQILKLKFEKVNNEEQPPENKRVKKEKYVSVINKAIWKRKQFSKLYSVTKFNFIDKQVRITEEILNVDKNVLNIKFQLALHFSNVKRNAVISIKALEGNGHIFKEFGQFFLSVAQHWLQELLRPYLVAPNESQAPGSVKNVDNKVNSDIQVSIKDIDEDTSSSEEEDTANNTEASEAVDNNTEPVHRTTDNNKEQEV